MTHFAITTAAGLMVGTSLGYCFKVLVETGGAKARSLWKTRRQSKPVTTSK